MKKTRSSRRVCVIIVWVMLVIFIGITTDYMLKRVPERQPNVKSYGEYSHSKKLECLGRAFS